MTSMMAAFEEEPNARQLQDRCYDLAEYKTPYSNDDRTVVYSGIMFDLFTKADPLEILTLEIDVRLPAVEDLQVEVYTTDGGYLNKLDDESKWNLVANTKAVASPDGSGIIIPQREFSKISVGARQRLSVYIQMRGPWIENRAQALVKTGELGNEGDDFYSYAGVGLAQRFSSSLETTTDPQFSGRVYYQKPKECDAVSKTTVDLQFIGGETLGVSTLSTLSSSVERVVEKHVLLEDWFKDQASASALKLVTNTKSTTSSWKGGSCPWTSCALLNSEVTFSHSGSLLPGELEYELFKYADGITREVKNLMGTEELAYVGYKSAMSGFIFAIKGVPENQPMNEQQENYLGRSLVSFFQESIQRTSTFVTVFDSQIASAGIDRRSLRARRKLNGEIEVFGTIFGGRSAALEREELVVQLQNSMRNEEDYLVQSLRYGSITPQSDLPDESVLSYFDKIESISGNFQLGPSVEADWEENPGGGGNNGGGGGGGSGSGNDNPKLDKDKIAGVTDKAGDSPIFLYVAAAIGGLILVGGGLFALYWFHKKKQMKKDLQDYRKSMKIERKVKRASKDSDDEFLKGDALKALQELADDDDDYPKTSSSKSDSDGAPPESARPRTPDKLDDSVRGRRSNRDTASLPDAESLRRASRSRSSERGEPGKGSSLLASFMEVEKSKKKPGDKLSGARSLDGDIERKLPSRTFSDSVRPRSQTSGDGPDKRKVQATRSSDDLVKLRSELSKRNAADSRGSPRNDTRGKTPDIRESRSHHGRSISGDLGGSAQASVSTSRSAHARSFSGDAGTGLYGSGPPRRGTRRTTTEDAPRQRGSSPSRQLPSRSQSSRAGIVPRDRSIRATRSSNADIAAMRQSQADPRSQSVRGTRSSTADISAMRKSQADVRAQEQGRRGRKRDEAVGQTTGGAPGGTRGGAPERTRSFDGGARGAPPPPPAKGAPAQRGVRRAKSSDI